MSKKHTLPLLRAISDFLIYLSLHKARSIRTLEQYAFHLGRFARFLDPKNPITAKINFHKTLLSIIKEELRDLRSHIRELERGSDIFVENITKEDIDYWRIDLLQKGVSQKTMNAHLITLRSFFKYLKKEGRENTLDPTSIDLIATKERKIVFLESHELIRLLQDIDQSEIQGKRDLAIMLAIYAGGLRISELTSLNISDIITSDGTIRGEFAIRGKGSKIRTIFLTEEAKIAIGSYLESRSDTFAPLFIRHNFDPHEIKSYSSEDVRLSRFFITTMIKDRGRKSGINKDISAHTLRHSFATTLLQNGADVRIIQELLGHSSITTTQVYTHVTSSALREAHSKFHHN